MKERSKRYLSIFLLARTSVLCMQRNPEVISFLERGCDFLLLKSSRQTLWHVPRHDHDVGDDEPILECTAQSLDEQTRLRVRLADEMGKLLRYHITFIPQRQMYFYLTVHFHTLGRILSSKAATTRVDPSSYL
jgi:hypothetical protein